jgi:hypothetical protein
MTEDEKELVAPETPTPGDAEAIRHFQEAVYSGQNWYLALLSAMGLWCSPEETINERRYQYLIDGEAFDWLLLAERLCDTVNGVIPEDEKSALLFSGTPPVSLTAAKIKQLMGDKKYTQYLNFFYGVTVEEALILAVQEEIEKERRTLVLRVGGDSGDESFVRIYSETRDELLHQFRHENRHPDLKTTSLTEMKEFTYWLFKYRLKRCEKAKIASDTKKALEYLIRHWGKRGISRVLATDSGVSPE